MERDPRLDIRMPNWGSSRDHQRYPVLLTEEEADVQRSKMNVLRSGLFSSRIKTFPLEESK